VTLMEVPLLRFPASSQDVSSIGSNDGTNFGIALPLRDIRSDGGVVFHLQCRRRWVSLALRSRIFAMGV
jgi:hypothetical protein